MKTLEGRTIAIPETRELELLARMLEAEGAGVVRCSLVSILDAEDPAPVRAWIDLLSRGGLDDVVLYTGEGVRRLAALARASGVFDAFVSGLSKVRKITRGPKPVVALRELDLLPDLRAESPTTDGIIETLAKFDLRDRRVGVQLYGTEPNEKLMAFLHLTGARVHPVAPYRYATRSEDERVEALIEDFADGRIDLVAFTSASQVDRLWSVAEASGRVGRLAGGLERTMVAAVGPVVAEALQRRGARVDALPERSFTLKPLVRVIAEILANREP